MLIITFKKIHTLLKTPQIFDAFYIDRFRIEEK